MEEIILTIKNSQRREVAMSYTLCLLIFLSLNQQIHGQTQIFARDDSVVQYPGKFLSNTDSQDLHIQALSIDNKTDTVVAGGRNIILQISFNENNQNPIKVIKLPPASNEFASCKQMKDEELCSNYVKVFVDSGANLVACGTNAGQPTCWEIEKSTFALLKNKNITGVSRCPSDPRENVTSVSVGTSLFTGVRLGPSDYGIAKTGIPALKEQIRTVNTQPTFNDANFVSSFQANDGFLYFFFREVSLEVIDRTIVLSRVSRICPYDVGESFVYENKFITFLKSQLVCMKKYPGQPTIYYDLLQSTFHASVHTNSSFAEDFIYGIFTSSFDPTGTSAVCRFRMVDIQKTFSTSPFLQKGSGNGYWEPVNHPGTYPDVARLNCTSNLDTNDYGTDSAHFATTHSLLANDVLPYDNDAIFAVDSASLTSLVVDDLHTADKNREVHVLFASTVDGRILKIVIDRSSGRPPVFVEEIFAFEKPQPIYSLKIAKGYLFASGNSGVARILLARCHQYKLCSSCVLSQNPYCGWSKSANSCNLIDDHKSPNDDLVTGSSQHCPSVKNDTSCYMQLVRMIAGVEAVLQCKPQGPSSPKVIGWAKDGVNITSLSYQSKYKVKKLVDGKEQLTFLEFTLQQTGTYTCIVSDGQSSQSCSITIEGSKPELSCIATASEMTNSVLECQCTARGDPLPVLTLVDDSGMRDHTSTHRAFALPMGTAVFAMSPFGKSAFICKERPVPPVTAKPQQGNENCPANYYGLFIVFIILFCIALLSCLILLLLSCCAKIRDHDVEDNHVRGRHWRVLGSKKLVLNPSLKLRTVPERQSSRKPLVNSKGVKADIPFQYVCTPTSEELKPINAKNNHDSNNVHTSNHVGDHAA